MFNSKIYIYISLLGLVFIIIIMTIIIGSYNSNVDKKIYKPQTNINETIKNKYIAKEYNKKIGIFEIDSNTLIYTIEVLVESLPEHDIESLKKGIEIKDDEALNKIIEDFES